MIILQVTFILLMHTIELRAYPTWEACLTAKAMLEDGEPPERGVAQRFDCIRKEDVNGAGH